MPVSALGAGFHPEVLTAVGDDIYAIVPLPEGTAVPFAIIGNLIWPRQGAVHALGA